MYIKRRSVLKQSPINKKNEKNKNIWSRLKLLASDSPSKNKEQWIIEQISEDSESDWFGSEVLYLIATANTKKTLHKIDDETNSSSSERYLALLRKKNSNSSCHLALFIIRDGEICVKYDWELRLLRSLDFGDNDNEILFSFDSADYLIHFLNNIERDETIWIIAQSSKLFSAVDCTIGFSVDLDTIGLGLAGTLTRFPLLQKLNSEIRVGIHGDVNEGEAELLLDELQLFDSNVENGLRSDLLKTLSQQSDLLNMEIIDYLLQWEDSKVNSAEVSHNAISLSSTPNSTPNMSPSKSELTPSQNELKKMRENTEVLDALFLVDKELEGVDDWIGEQLDRLVGIQTKLAVIETESGSLESSWQNLTSIETLLEIIVSNLSISSNEESLINNPINCINESFLIDSLINADVILEPLNNSLKTLYRGLSLQGGNNKGEISLMDWKKILTLSSISSQRQKLKELSDNFCQSLLQITPSIFDSILKHKCLNNLLYIKSFNFKSVIDQGFNYRFISVKDDDVDKTLDEFNKGYPLELMTSIEKNEFNQFYICQRFFRSCFYSYVPIFESLFKLDATKTSNVLAFYIGSVQDKLYVSLIKLLFKELHSNLTPRHSLFSFSNFPNYNIKNKENSLNLIIKFNPISKNLTPWAAFGVSLLILVPVIQKEEHFIESFFSDCFKTEKKQELLYSSLDDLFDTFSYRVEKLMNPVHIGADTDGIEAMAFLVVLDCFLKKNLGLQQDSLDLVEKNLEVVPIVDDMSTLTISLSDEIGISSVSDSTSSPKKKKIHNSFLIKILFEMKQMFINKINVFVNEQVSWISHQSYDPKKASVLAPMSKFPFLLHQILEMTGGITIICIEEAIHKIARELFAWTSSVASSNEKYSNIVKIHNYGFFAKSIGPLKYAILEEFVNFAGNQEEESINNYIDWMVLYTFPMLAALAKNMEGVGSRVSDEQLALYVRRKDVIAVIKELDIIHLDQSVLAMRKRLDKHCISSDQDATLANSLWTLLRDRIIGIIVRLERAASKSYQISLSVGPVEASVIFDKYNITQKD